MMKRIDLHTHTTASDGIYSPVELINYAMKNNIIAMAITDHDTVNGLEEGMEYASSLNFNLIPGVEFSIDYSIGSFHLVGLNIDYKSAILLETLEREETLRLERASKIVNELSDYGLDISFNEVLNRTNNRNIGKSHIAREVVSKGYCKDIYEVFQNFMVKGKPGYVEREKLSANDAVSIIKESGGISVIAHPSSLNLDSVNAFENIVKDLIAPGLSGIEVYSSMNSIEEIELYKKIAREYDLLISGGSDFHGDKGEEIGFYAEGRAVPLSILNEIEKHI